MVTKEQMERYERFARKDGQVQAVTTIAFWAALAVLALTFYMAWDQDAAMKSCMAKGMSYDTCFHSLNR